MSWKKKLAHELKLIALLTLYFGLWIAGLVLIKELLLAEYGISFHHWSVAFIGALILSKAVLILEHVSLPRNIPAWLEIMLRTLLYALGVFAVLALEKGLEGRAEHGGFAGAVVAAFRGVDAPHLIVNTLTISVALLSYNFLNLMRRHLGKGGLRRILLDPVPAEEQQEHSGARGTSA